MSHYETLEISKGASEEEIKKAHRRLVKKYHPDKEGGDEERFKAVQKAYEVLSDPEKRKEYDSFSEKFNFKGYDFQRRGHTKEQWKKTEDVFNRYRDRQKGYLLNAYTTANVNLHTACFGGEVKVRLGSDELQRVQVPPGVQDGQQVKYPEAGFSDKFVKGDLFVTFSVNENPHFWREGTDIYTAMDVNVFDALTGATAEVVTLEGKKLQFKIRKGTQPGSKVRFKGHGALSQSGDRGDFLAVLNVSIPDVQDPATINQLKVIKQRLNP
jgi:DnaJ-class molecular chaperone